MRRMFTKEEIEDIAEEHGGGGGSYTAGEGILINNKTISVNTSTIATIEYVDDSVIGFVTQSEVEDMLEDYQPKLTAGSNITINGNTISASDTTYSAGTGITITGQTIGVSDTIATKTDLQQGLATKITSGAISVSESGSATDNVRYITIEGTQHKIGGATYTASNGVKLTGTIIQLDTTYALPQVKLANTIYGSTIPSTGTVGDMFFKLEV